MKVMPFVFLCGFLFLAVAWLWHSNYGMAALSTIAGGFGFLF